MTTPTKFKHRMRLALLAMVSVFVLISVYGVYQLNAHKNQTVDVETSTLFTIKKGSSLNRVCAQLTIDNRIKGCLAHRLLAKFELISANIKSGTYWLHPEQSLDATLDMFNRGEEAQFAFTIIEGDNAYQIMQKLQQNEYISFDIKSKIDDLTNIARELGLEQSHIEGLLAPDTYYFTFQSNASDLLKRAFNVQQQRLESAWRLMSQRASDEQTLLASPYELLILASIIEKESGIGAERTTIASVFYNRLRKNMRLQTDPTVIYGVWDEYDGDIKRVHLKTKTPYNTYRIKGLPPTPIASPSVASLQAAASPEHTNYYYFVASGEGGHTFSETLRDHNRALQSYLLKTKS